MTRVLVIDDSKAMRSILTSILSDLELEVEAVENAERAAEVLAQGPGFDLALVDWNLPGMSGLELVRVIRSDPRGAAIKLMMVTTETELNRVREALETGADEYIMKPFDKEMLREKLALLGIADEIIDGHQDPRC
jgi:two-component system chemotaxis response regulator CheY